jgi:hypothetical protein
MKYTAFVENKKKKDYAECFKNSVNFLHFLGYLPMYIYISECKSLRG